MAILEQKYIAPPFSVLNTRAGYWQKKKKQWAELGMYDLQGRDDDVLGNSQSVSDSSKTGFKTIGVNASKFDPVLTEIVYTWFAIHNSKILDPFAGGAVRGGIAGILGHDYHGFDTSDVQIRDNVSLLTSKGINANYICDTSENIDEYYDDNEFDLMFSCPPYFNLERYSENPKDLSTINDYDGFKSKYIDIINKCCNKLKNDRFAVFVVGDVRDKKGAYINFVGDTITAFINNGLCLYNNAILLEQCGTKAMTCEKAFVNRKLSKVHQNVLIFYKGDIKKIKQIFKY